MPAVLFAEPSTASKRPTDDPRYMIQTESWSRDADKVVGPDGLSPWELKQL